jgi:hypothetical protein
MLFEVHGLILALHHDARFLRHPGAIERARAAFARVLDFYAAGPAAAPVAAGPSSRPAGTRRAARPPSSRT